jgi:hypothetical protein
MPICVDSLPDDVSYSVLAFGASVRVSRVVCWQCDSGACDAADCLPVFSRNHLFVERQQEISNVTYFKIGFL